MPRIDGRGNDEMREVKITRSYLKHPEGSALIEVGDTKVICTVSVEDRVPIFQKGTGQGWVTAEYSMLPRATGTRNIREVNKGRPSGRTQEIQRLIGRSLRSVVDLKALGERTLWVDCDVIQADGGTRTASVTAAFVSMVEAIEKIHNGNGRFPVRDFLAAISVGIIGGEAMLDLCYHEDSQAEVDMNVVMSGDGRFVEVQSTAEGEPFSRCQMESMLGLAESGITKLIDIQLETLGDIADRIGS